MTAFKRYREALRDLDLEFTRTQISALEDSDANMDYAYVRTVSKAIRGLRGKIDDQQLIPIARTLRAIGDEVLLVNLLSPDNSEFETACDRLQVLMCSMWDTYIELDIHIDSSTK